VLENLISYSMLFAIFLVFVTIYFRLRCVLALANEFNKSVLLALSYRKFTKTYLPRSNDSSEANKYHKLFMKCMKVTVIGFSVVLILVIMHEGL
jgi:hypothetical protein